MTFSTSEIVTLACGKMDFHTATVVLTCIIIIPGGMSYRPVILVHGILDDKASLYNLSARIQKLDEYVPNGTQWLAAKYAVIHIVSGGCLFAQEHPGTNVTILDLYHGWESLVPLWTQVSKFSEKASEIMAAAGRNGVHMIGYSQGGLIARGVLSILPNHTVNTFISLSSPQMGQYGNTDYIRLLFPQYVKENLYKIFYRSFGQLFSVGNYWNDPHHQGQYRNHSAFLAVINNETLNPRSEEFKSNFLRINRIVLIGGPDDGVITPWQSRYSNIFEVFLDHFGFYDEHEEIVEMANQEVFKKDSFGLGTLNKRKRIYTYSVPGVQHLKWHENITVFQKCILPWLT